MDLFFVLFSVLMAAGGGFVLLAILVELLHDSAPYKGDAFDSSNLTTMQTMQAAAMAQQIAAQNAAAMISPNYTIGL